MTKISPVRGMSDILPEDINTWQFIESTWQKIAKRYGFQEIRMPLLEDINLFKRSIGDVTDIVQKEMFVLKDRDGNELALRPEGTASCVRACLTNNLFNLNSQQKLWYQGPMFRYERPQKGRYRQFHQIGVESFGIESYEAELEHIITLHKFWEELGIRDKVVLQINSIGQKHSRLNYITALQHYFNSYLDALTPEEVERLGRNPLRLLDSKNPKLQEIIKSAPSLIDYIDDESKDDLNNLLRNLDQLGINYFVNNRIVRGLDYYNKTVYEWVTTELGAQGAVAAGGRFDSLINQLGGMDSYASGFAIGIERVFLLMQNSNLNKSKQLHAYLITVGDDASLKRIAIGERIRQLCPKINLEVNLSTGSVKSRFKKADQSGATVALIIGEDELKDDKITIKFLRNHFEQMLVPINELNSYLIKNQVLEAK